MTISNSSVAREAAANASGADVQASECARQLHALERAHERVRSVRGNAEPSADAKFETLAFLDDQVRDALSRLEFSPRRVGTDSARRLVALGRDLFGELLDGFAECADAYHAAPAGRALGQRSGECMLRLAGAGAARVLWERLSGGPAHPSVWRLLGEAFMRTRGVEGANGAGAVRREFLRAVAAHSAALEPLPPQLAIFADRLLSFVLPMLRLEDTVFGSASFVVTPCDPAGPRRMMRPPESGTDAWFFSPGVAVAALEELADHIAAGDTPPRLAQGADAEWGLARVIEHLVRHWSPTPPMRRFRRHLIGGTLTAVRGFEQLKRLFAGGNGICEAEWSLRDVSRGGVGAVLASADEGQVRVGELVAIRATGGANWQLAVVRRTWREAGAVPLVGLETLSQRPVQVRVDDGRSATDVFLCDPVLRGEAVRVAAPPRHLEPGGALFVTSGGKIQKLKPLEGSMSGEDFELRVYQVL